MKSTKKYILYVCTISLLMTTNIAFLLPPQQTAQKGVLAPVPPLLSDIPPMAVDKTLPTPSPLVPPKQSPPSVNLPTGFSNVALQSGGERMQWLQIKRHFEAAKKNGNEEALISIKHFVSPYFGQLLRKLATKESEDIISIFEGLSGIPSIRDVLTEGVIDFFEIHTASQNNEQKRLRFSGMIANMRMKLAQATSLLTTDRVSTSERAYKFFALLDTLAHKATRSLPQRVYARLGAKGLVALTALLFGGGLAYWKGNEAYQHVQERFVRPVQTTVQEGADIARITKKALTNLSQTTEGGPFAGLSKLVTKEAIFNIKDAIVAYHNEAQKKTSEDLEQIEKSKETLKGEIAKLGNEINALPKSTFGGMSAENKAKLEPLKKQMEAKIKKLQGLERGIILEDFVHAAAKGLGEGIVENLAKNPELIEKAMPGLTGKFYNHAISTETGQGLAKKKIENEVTRTLNNTAQPN